MKSPAPVAGSSGEPELAPIAAELDGLVEAFGEQTDEDAQSYFLRRRDGGGSNVEYAVTMHAISRRVHDRLGGAKGLFAWALRYIAEQHGIELDVEAGAQQQLAAACAALAQQYTERDLSGLKVLWSVGASNRRRHFIGQLPSGSYCLLTKKKRRWCFFEGDRDSVLATVPDELFAAASKAVIGR